MSLLQLQKAGIRFGGLRAVAELDLSLEEGSLHGLIGPNGAGKTTVFNMITGLYIPTAGEIAFFGEELPVREPEPEAAAARVRRGGVRCERLSFEFDRALVLVACA